MLKLKIFSVYDCKAEAYLQPFFVPTTGEAVRSFTTEVNRADSNLSNYAEDYTLFELGEWDALTAGVTLYSTPKSLGKALEYKKQDNIIPMKTPSHNHAQL